MGAWGGAAPPGDARLPQARGRTADPAGAWGAQPPAEDARSPSGPRSHRRPAGGVGAQPPQIETPRAGGWARAALRGIPASTEAPCACSSGMGTWGAQPPIDGTRLPSGPRLLCQPAGGVGAQPPRKETPRAGGRARAALRGIPASTEAPCACSSAMGAWGAQPPAEDARLPSGPRSHRRSGRGRGGAAPTERNSEGGRVGRAARCALSQRYGAAMTSVSAARWAALSSGAGMRPKNSTARAERPSSAWTGALAWNGASSSGSSSTIVRTQRR